MDVLDEILEGLSDGNWHSLNELSTHGELEKLSKTQLMVFVKFLARFDFIELNCGKRIVEAKIHPSIKVFIREMKELERQEEIGGKV